MIEHKLGSVSLFTSKYNCNRLVYCRGFDEVHEAIAHEKEVKGWTRAKKIALIEADNPKWEDLAAYLDESVEEKKIAAVNLSERPPHPLQTLVQRSFARGLAQDDKPKEK